MYRVALSLFLFFPLLFFSQFQYEKYLFVKGSDTLPYKLLKPDTKFAGKKLPLVIFFHGAGERGKENEYQSIHIDKLFCDSANRNDFACYLIAPQCPKEKKWADMDWTKKNHTQPANPSAQIEMTHKLIDSLKKMLNVDTNRIYVTGLSMGGFGTWDYCARYPKEIAAAIPVCGGYDTSVAKRIKTIPFWVFHGAIDNLVPVENSRNMVKALKKQKANVKYSEIPKVKHGVWVNAYKDNSILKWMFSFSLDKKK